MDYIKYLESHTPTLPVKKAYGEKWPHWRITCGDMWTYFESILDPSDSLLEWASLHTREYLIYQPPPFCIFNPSSAFGRAILSFSPQKLFPFLVVSLDDGAFYYYTYPTRKRILPLLPKKRLFKHSHLLHIKSRLLPTHTSPTKPLIHSSPLSPFHHKHRSFNLPSSFKLALITTLTLLYHSTHNPSQPPTKSSHLPHIPPKLSSHSINLRSIYFFQSVQTFCPSQVKSIHLRQDLRGISFPKLFPRVGVG